MNQIKHQINQTEPNWEVHYLFIGTFNPDGGEPVPYYYGRSKNQFWGLLSEIFKTDFDVNSSLFFNQLKENKIACVDIIDTIYKNDNSDFSEKEIEKICGKGYSDSVIISKNYQRVYSTKLILQIIEKNPNIQVFSTWGKGKKLKNWQLEVAKINFSANLVSPSLAARVPKGESKFKFMLKNWKQVIKV